jgi:NitT/TauT family transport system substrate-binding protein
MTMSTLDCVQVRARRATVSKRTLMLGVAAMLALLAGASQSYAQNKNISVTIQPTGTALPVVVADKKGMFAKHDVQVKWSVSRVPISDSITTLGRQFDIMMGTQPALIAAVGQGIPVVIVSGGGLDTPKRPMSNIVARAASGITTFKQLDGKTVGTLSLTGNIHFSLLNILHKEGVDHNKIRWVLGTVPQLPDLLRAGRVDAIEEIEPFATFAIQAGGIALGNPFRSISDRAFIGLWLAQRDWANKNQDLVLRFNRAMAEAATWIHANMGEAKEILGSYTGLKDTALEKTPLPEYHFSTTAADLSAQHLPEFRTWNDILAKTSDIKPVKVEDLLPSWAQK